MLKVIFLLRQKHFKQVRSVIVLAMVTVSFLFLTGFKDDKKITDLQFPDNISSIAGKKYSEKEFKSLYLESGKIIIGELVKVGKINEPAGITPQTQFLYKNINLQKGELYKQQGYNWTFTVYDSGLGDLEKQEIGKTYITFLSVAYGEELASFENNNEIIKMLNKWKRFGTESVKDLKKKVIQSEWVVIASKLNESCRESYPRGHYWRFNVVKAIKGDEIPKTINLRGSYRSHNNIPSYLKDTEGKKIFFMRKNASKDVDVLLTVPWSTELENIFLTD